ncbi:MAG: hypothetical protein HeimC3_41730 [Candidatus Heimdallarchaeota archaeon LC_3]|nr:MAG: hypothetical protein HeimC3_41730 [Candidatus Heimdallarchaeota archaeon LC_3]
MKDHCSLPSENENIYGKGEDYYTIALAGNANVGKSVIFNQLTGSNQIIGNWPGKTVDMATGAFNFKDYSFKIIDLPGIYSFTTYSLEELISKEYIIFEKPVVIINVIDASVLERNLNFTLQLIEMEVPLILCINQTDVAKRKGIVIDIKKLQKKLGIPVVSTVAVKGEGLNKLMEAIINQIQNNSENNKTSITYDIEIENRINQLINVLRVEQFESEYPLRWIAIKLLECDLNTEKIVSSKSDIALLTSNLLTNEIESIYSEPSFSKIISERYNVANKISNSVQQQTKIKQTFSEKLDYLVMHKIFGYIISLFVISFLLLWTFIVGSYLSEILSEIFSIFEPVDPQIAGPLLSVLWNGAFGGIVAGITLIIPFVLPFYFMLTIIEDSGILTRVAFMMDSFMHKIGLHGKAIIPLILGYGCSVPAIYSTRILETRRERLLASFTITLAPCSARTIVILGLVAVFVSVEWALALYVIDILIIFILGRIAFKVNSGETTGLIMEMHSFKFPSFYVVSRQTWTRTKSIIRMVFPMYIIGSAIVQGMYIFGLLEPINNLLSPITVYWLGLPAITGILLIFGIVRKEYILLLLVAIFGTNLSLVLTPIQFLVLALVGMLYLPCISTFTILSKEFGRKPAIGIALANLATALIIGGIAFRVLPLLL